MLTVQLTLGGYENEFAARIEAQPQAGLPRNPFAGQPFECERKGKGIRIVIPEIEEEWLPGAS